MIFYVDFYQRNVEMTDKRVRVNISDNGTMFVHTGSNLNGRIFRINDGGRWCVAYGCRTPSKEFTERGYAVYKYSPIIGKSPIIDDVCDILRESPTMTITQALKFAKL